MTTASNTVINGFISRDVGAWLKSLFRDLKNPEGFSWCMTIEDTEEKCITYYEHEWYREALKQIERAIPEEITREIEATATQSDGPLSTPPARKLVAFSELLSSRSFSKSDPPTGSSLPTEESLDGETDGASYRLQAVSGLYPSERLAGEEHELNTKDDEELAEAFEAGASLT